MDSTPKQLKLNQRQKNYLKGNNWTSFITIFNEVHNTDLKTNIGKVNVQTKKK